MLMENVRRFCSIRSGGGSIGKRGEAKEEEFFRKKRHEQLNKMKKDEISKKEIEAEHQEAAENKRRITNEQKSGKKIERVKKK